MYRVEVNGKVAIVCDTAKEALEVAGLLLDRRSQDTPDEGPAPDVMCVLCQARRRYARDGRCDRCYRVDYADPESAAVALRQVAEARGHRLDEFGELSTYASSVRQAKCDACGGTARVVRSPVAGFRLDGGVLTGDCASMSRARDARSARTPRVGSASLSEPVRSRPSAGVPPPKRGSIALVMAGAPRATRA